MKATIDISGFNRGMTGFVDRLGIEAPIVLKKEMGELLKTLVKVTPPRSAEKTREGIERDIRSRFASIEYDHAYEDRHYNKGVVGPSRVLWYAVDSKFLRGIAPDKDMRKASVEQLERLRWRITPHGRLNLPFRFPHKRQRVLLYQTILTKRSTVKRLIAKTQRHVGRLKAGWLAAWDHLGPRGGNQPPGWVMRHMVGNQGWFLDGLGVKNHPTFTIANFAVGIGNRRNNMNWIVQNALNIRAKAMAANLRLFMRGKKRLIDYAK